MTPGRDLRAGRQDPDAVREEPGGARRASGSATHILDELKVNSARLVDVVLAFEDEFDIEIADEDVDSVKTVGDCGGADRSRSSR